MIYLSFLVAILREGQTQIEELIISLRISQPLIQIGNWLPQQ